MDCVVPFVQPHSPLLVQRTLRGVLLALQHMQSPYWEVNRRGAAVCYGVCLPSQAVYKSSDHAPLSDAWVQIDFWVENRALTRLHVAGGGQASCTGEFLSVAQTDALMCSAVMQAQDKASNTKLVIERLLRHWCRWTQDEHKNGHFRPLLRDILLRPGLATFDPDIRDFCFHYIKVGPKWNFNATTAYICNTFDRLRSGKRAYLNGASKIDNRLLKTFAEHLFLVQGVEQSSVYYHTLQDVTKWLYVHRPDLSLAYVCTQWMQGDGDNLLQTHIASCTIDKDLLRAAFTALWPLVQGDALAVSGVAGGQADALLLGSGPM
jgi:hypothetical protein